ncbi:MAG: primosomal protein N' [Nitrospirae bacterium]|nr:primosomal protein N' [Nitrospirota bacterium]
MVDRIVRPDDNRPIAEVVLLKQFDRVLHYSVPESLLDRLEPGMRVLVPFRTGWRTGIVTRRLQQADVARVKPILELLDSTPTLDRPMMALARWLSDYYMTGWGVAMKAILPTGLEVNAGRHYRMTEAGRKAMSGSFRTGEVGRQFLAVLEKAPRGLRLEPLLERIKTTKPSRRGDHQRRSGPLSILVRKGWVEETMVLPRRRSSTVKEAPVSRSPRPPVSLKAISDPENMTASMPADLERAVHSGRFSAACLEGQPDRTRSTVTAVMMETLRRGRSVIILVPEIGRVSGWAGRLRARVGDGVGILHSGLSDRERRAEWEKARRGDVSIVVGTRLAVFAPVPNPGLIVVEDEQDTAYKQEEAPRYHARDVAVLRGTHDGALVLLTGASPSVETYANIQNGKYQSVHLADQQAGLPARPSVSIVNLADQPRGMFVSEELLAAVTARLEQKEPVVLFLNRRGFGTALYCRDCGVVVRCSRCHVATVYSKRSGRLSCPYCGMADYPPTTCSGCRGTHLEILGAGTERVEEFLKARFPSASILRLDRDTARPGDVSAAIERLNRSEVDLIIGTQLLLSGPPMTRSGLIGLLLADGALHLPDFRAGEHTFRLISRILNFSVGGEVILQTYHPTHESIAWAVTGDPKEFYEQELAQRKALGYPPFVRLAAVTVKALNESKAEAAAQRLVENLKRAVRSDDSRPGFQILGPVAAMRPRLRGKYRRQILIKAPDSRTLHEALASGLRALRSESGRSNVWFEVDVDPLRIE